LRNAFSGAISGRRNPLIGVTTAFDKLQQALKKLPGVGFRSSERIALHLLVGKPEQLGDLVGALQEASRSVRRCDRCGNLSEDALCSVCADPRRDHRSLCVVESVPDLVAIERSGSWRSAYHVLHGKLSPMHGVGPDDLNLASLNARIASGEVDELVLALPNDVEGEATCHYIQEKLPAGSGVTVTRIGFGIPSGGGVLYADSVTLRSALESRRAFT
jgi:recombination protein RecR